MVSWRRDGRIRSVGSSGNAAAAARDGFGSGGEMVAASELDEAGARGRVDGRRVAAAAAAVGGAELAHVPRSSIPVAALPPDARRFCARRIQRVDGYVALA